MRIIGINIPDNKRVEAGLTYIYGVGPKRSQDIIRATGINPDKRVKELQGNEISLIKEFIEKNYKVEGELRHVIRQNISLLKEMQAYRGLRHIKRLPARGQRTKTNSRTIRGNVRKTAGSGKRKVELK